MRWPGRLIVAAALIAAACAPGPSPMPVARREPTATITPTARPVPPTLATPRPTPVPIPDNILGVHLLLDDGRNTWPPDLWRDHLTAAQGLIGAGGWVVELVRLDDLEVDRWQRLFDLCATLGLKPILRLGTTFDQTAGFWTAPTPGPGDGYAQTAERYAAFVAGLRWPTDTHPVLVGNEPNHGDEWGGRADPAAYARFLRDVAAALRAADPAVLVLNAPLDPYSPNTNDEPFINGFTYVDSESFMDEMRAEVPDVFAGLDAWASHAYPTGPLANGPWDQVFQIDLLNGATNREHLRPPAGMTNRGINGYAWELAKLESYGVTGLDVWITEVGWRHAESVDPSASDGTAAWPPAATVGQWFDLALNGNGGRYPQWPEDGWTAWRADPRVRAVIYFALDGAPKEWGHTNWLQLSDDGAVLGAYPLLRAP